MQISTKPEKQIVVHEKALTETEGFGKGLMISICQNHNTTEGLISLRR